MLLNEVKRIKNEVARNVSRETSNNVYIIR